MVFGAVILVAIGLISVSRWLPSKPSSDSYTAATITTDHQRGSGSHEPASTTSGRTMRQGPSTSTTGQSGHDDERLGALRASSAADALAHARRLPLDDAGRLSVLLAIASICRPLETSDRNSYVANSVVQGWVPDTERQRQLLAEWWNRMAQYCGAVVGSQVRAEAEQSLSARKARSDLLFAGRQQIDTAELASRDPEDLFLLLDQVDISRGEDARSQPLDADIVDALWSVFLKSPNPELALQAGTALSGLGDGAFAATRKLISADPSDPRLWDGNTFHGNSRPSSREIKVWEAAVEVFVCRTAAVCGPATARGLSRRPVSELQLAMGSEGYWRSTLSPLEWDAVEAVVRQLQAERQASLSG
jgi:hypothetical protein